MWARLGIMVVTWCAGLGWIHNRCMMGLVTGKCIKFWNVVRPACDCSVSIRQQTLVKLTRLRLNDNQLSGNIPAALGNLSSLTFLRLAGTNQFTGCVPSGLRGVADNDLADLGLPFC